MLYASIEALSGPIREHLPLHAQEIYRSAFNNAWERYTNRGESQEEIAHRIAWAAVKRQYCRIDGAWVER